MTIGIGAHDLTTFASASSCASNAVTLTSGSSVAVWITGRTASTSVTPTVTDSAGNTYTQIEALNTGFWLFNCNNVTGGSGIVVSVTIGLTMTAGMLFVAEITGTDGLDVHASAGSLTASQAVTTATTTVANELVLTGGVSKDSNNPSSLACTGETIIDQNLVGSSTAQVSSWGYDTISATGAQTRTWTTSSAHVMGAFVATYKASSAVTVSLTGLGMTASAGTLGPSSDVSLTGAAVTASGGTVTPSSDTIVPLTGLSVTASAGALGPSASIALTGQAATTSRGTLVPDTSVPLTSPAMVATAGEVSEIGGSPVIDVEQSAYVISTPRDYSTFDRNRVGPGLLLDGSDLQVTTDSACDINRTILGTLPALSGDFMYEVYFWSQSQGDLSDLISFGVATVDAALDTYVGGDVNGYGYRPADGEIHNDGASIESVAATAERVSLQCYLHLRPSEATVGWYVNGNELYVASLPTGKAWVPALSIGSTSPSDLAAIVNFGQNRFDHTPRTIGGPTMAFLLPGWSQQKAGLATFYLSLATEAFMSAPDNDPPNTPFDPRQLNGNQVSVNRQPFAWFHRSGGGANPSALTTIRLDNSQGSFNALLAADVRDSLLVLRAINAPVRGAGSLNDARTVFTGILDNVQANSSTIDLALRDTLTQFDRPIPCRIIPPFYDASSAGKIRPIGLGAQRLVQPLVLDQEKGLYLLGDSPVSNIVLASDMGAPLDPNSLPPQYTPALDNEGIQLATPPVGRLAVDCSTIGDQYEIPGAADVLNGDGDFTGWTATSGVPTTTPPPDFDWSNNASSQLVRLFHPAYLPTGTSARIITARTWYPPTSQYGDYLVTNTEPLLAGRSYRLTLSTVVIGFSPPILGGNNVTGGFMVRTALSDNPADAVTAHGVPITVPSGYRNTFSAEFTVPLGSSRNLYLMAIASSGFTDGSANGNGSVEFFGVKLELLGQYIDLPLQGITCLDAFTEILVNRAGADPSVFSADDCANVDGQAGYTIGLRWEDTPNILDALTQIADAFGAIIFTDQFGVIRIRRWESPDTGDVVAAFDRGCLDPDSIRIYDDDAPGLTNLFAGKPNCTPFGAGDFVSDTNTVSAATRAAYQAPAQFFFTASERPAQQYIGAVGAGRRILPIDDNDAARGEGNRINGQFTVKRKWVQFDVKFEGHMIGVDTQVSVEQLLPGDLVTLDIPELGLNAQRMRVRAPQPYPLGGKITLIGWY